MRLCSIGSIPSISGRFDLQFNSHCHCCCFCCRITKKTTRTRIEDPKNPKHPCRSPSLPGYSCYYYSFVDSCFVCSCFFYCNLIQFGGVWVWFSYYICWETLRRGQPLDSISGWNWSANAAHSTAPLVFPTALFSQRPCLLLGTCHFTLSISTIAFSSSK